MRIFPLAAAFITFACSSAHEDATCSAMGCTTPTGVTLPFVSNAYMGEVTACIDDTCTLVTFRTQFSQSPVFDFHGREVFVSVSNDGKNVYVHFSFGSPPPADGAVFRATLRDTVSGTTAGVKSDPVQWDVTYPGGEACGPACVAPKNLVVHPI